MASLKDTFISPTVYNSLPHITEVSNVPTDHSTDLADLRSLLAKHSVPSGVSVRLIHKHFDTIDREVMAFKQVTAQPFGRVLVMRPVKSPETFRLRGVNYFVDKDGSLQAYEYTEGEVLDMSNYATFLAKFCALIVKRGLQHKLGLKLKSDWEITNWTEFEFPCQRSTIIIPKGMPTPEGNFSTSVVTEWGAKDPEDGTGEPKGHWCLSHRPACYSHCQGHCYHCDWHDETKLNDDEWYLGGQKIEPGTPVHGLVTAIIEVW